MTPHLKEFIRELDNENYIDASRDEVVIKLIEKLVEAEKEAIIQAHHTGQVSASVLDGNHYKSLSETYYKLITEN